MRASAIRALRPCRVIKFDESLLMILLRVSVARVVFPLCTSLMASSNRSSELLGKTPRAFSKVLEALLFKMPASSNCIVVLNTSKASAFNDALLLSVALPVLFDKDWPQLTPLMQICLHELLKTMSP